MGEGLPERGTWNATARRVLAVAAIGAQFGIFEACILQHRGFAVTVSALAGIVAGHAIVGLALGLPFLLLAHLLTRRLPSLLNDALRVSPAVFVLFSMAAITVNVRQERTVANPVSVAW